MKVKRAYRYRFYPTLEQEVNLAQTFGCTRYVYNEMLHLRTDAFYKHGEKVNYHDTSFLLTRMKHNGSAPWLNEVSSVPLQQGLRHLHTAFLNFWAGRTKYPKFKRKYDKQSAEYTASAFRYKDGTLKLAKQKDPLDIRWSRSFTGKPSTVTVSKDKAGRYFVSILVEEYIQPLPPNKNQVGVDMGIKDVVVTSDGFKSGAPKYTRKYEKKLARAQRNLARKKKGSRNRAKARVKAARIHAKIADSRRDFNHKLTTKLIRENGTICIETLAVKNMMRNRNLAKTIADSSMGEIRRMLEYKAEWYGRELIGIDRWFPSTKRCFECGHINSDLKLSDREWTCPKCSAKLDRDINASRNILAAGQAVSAFGDSVSLVSNVGTSSNR
jgi:putative transposase